MRYAYLFVAMLVWNIQASALELKHEYTLSEADANYCGDMNEIAVFTIESLNESDTSEWNQNQFVLNTQNFRVLNKVIQKELDAESSLVVTNQFERALNHLVDDLSLDYDRNNEPYLSSCHSLEILKKFGLRVSNSAKRIQPIRERADDFSYITVSEVGEFGASDLKYNIAVDLNRRRILVYRIW